MEWETIEHTSPATHTDATKKSSILAERTDDGSSDPTPTQVDPKPGHKAAAPADPKPRGEHRRVDDESTSPTENRQQYNPKYYRAMMVATIVIACFAMGALATAGWARARLRHTDAKLERTIQELRSMRASVDARCVDARVAALERAASTSCPPADGPSAPQHRASQRWEFGDERIAAPERWSVEFDAITGVPLWTRLAGRGDFHHDRHHPQPRPQQRHHVPQRRASRRHSMDGLLASLLDEGWASFAWRDRATPRAEAPILVRGVDDLVASLLGDVAHPPAAPTARASAPPPPEAKPDAVAAENAKRAAAALEEAAAMAKDEYMKLKAEKKAAKKAHEELVAAASKEEEDARPTPASDGARAEPPPTPDDARAPAAGAPPSTERGASLGRDGKSGDADEAPAAAPRHTTPTRQLLEPAQTRGVVRKLRGLSIKQLRALLEQHGQECRTCVEKDDLVARVLEVI